jgi:spoIIIJ-associated protein
MEFREYKGKNVDEAITNACVDLGITAEKLEYEIIEKGGNGFLGIGSKPAIIKARKTESIEDIAREFLNKVFTAMELAAKVDINIEEGEKENVVNINVIGDDMGILIGKRGQTLDSLQYLVSLVINKNKENEKFNRVKLDTENYRERRKATLENLAKNIALKVKRIKKPVSLEPMNPYERRIIHSALQNDKYCTTKSEGEEPYRHVVVMLKRENR